MSSIDKGSRISLEDLPSNVRVWVTRGTFDAMTPKQIIDHLDQYVIGQPDAKKLLAVATANHIAAEVYNRDGPRDDVKATSIMLTGPSGSGKTYLIQTLAKKLNRVFLPVDITHFSPTGYVGKNVHGILKELLTAAEGCPIKAQQGIVLIDEVDKISGYCNSEDFSSTSIQRSLLKMVEGDLIEVEGMMIDTSKIMWVFAGSFDKYITDKQSEAAKSRPGFGDTVKAKDVKAPELTHAKLIELGMLREFVGRVGHIAQLDTLKTGDYKKILTEVRNAPLTQLKNIAEARGIELKVTDKDINAIVKKAVDLGVGARGLRIITEQHFLDQLL